MQAVSLKIGTATPKSLVVEPKPLDKLFKLYAFSQGGVMMTTQLKKAETKDIVLSENTAQGVYQKLNELMSNRASRLTRWIWELLQNARDASMGTDSLIATVQCLPNELTFLHNGKGFTDREIAHLIFHGSTKVEEERTIGQYGTGFLTTHLLSPTIDVSGQLNTGQWFNFCLERKPDSVEALRELMDLAWKNFTPTPSLQVPIPDRFTTQFVYPFGEDARDAVEEGITTLKQCAPFVVVFNQEFSRINIENRGETMCFEVVERPPLDSEGIQQITVAESTDGNRRERKYLLAQGQETSVAIPLESDGDSSVCSPIEDTPRLFLGFPLVGTESFSFPAVINSFKFTPTEDRDGVYLGQSDNDENIRNQGVIEEACQLLVKMLRYAASSGWRNAHLLTKIPPIQKQNWLNTKWLGEHIIENFIKEIRQTPAVLNEDGNTVAPANAMLLLEKGDAGVKALWDLLADWRGNRERLPRQDEAAGWCKAIKSWVSVSDPYASEFGEGGAQLAERVEKRCSSLTDLQGLLQEDICAVEWLNRFYRFLRDNGFDKDIQNRRFVPDQVGRFDQLPKLYRDQGIDEELKEIAELLEWHIRHQLRDTQLVPLDEKTGAGEWNSEHVVGKLIDKLKERARENPDNNFKEASARLFAWIVNQKDWDRLQGFPVFAEDGNSDISLGQVLLGDNQLLVPVRAWAEDLQPYSELFPQRRILDNTFFEKAPDPDVWHTLDQENFLRKDVIITKEVYHESFLPAGPLTDEEDHRTVEQVKVTNVAFLTTDDIGIVDRVRQSQRLACRFWQFLTEWLIVHDSKGLETCEAPCECGENHRYYPAEWLVPLEERKWVPLGNRKSDYANAQSLASLLRDSGWDPSSLNQNPEVVKLLQAIGVSQFELMRGFVTESDEERSVQESALTEILVASGDNLSRVPELVQYMEDDENLLQHLGERRNRMHIARKNQQLGQHVEELVKANLKQSGFCVHRTGTGSDFEIAEDTVDLGVLDIVQGSQHWLVEVKSTRGQSVLMSSRQAETAVEEVGRFLLCIVPIVEDTEPDLDTVKKDMRFINNIGSHIAPLCQDFADLEEWRAEVTANRSFEGFRLVYEAGTRGIRVSKSVWESDGFPLADLAENLQTNA